MARARAKTTMKAKTKSKAKVKRVNWTAADVKLLKSQARRVPAARIARELRRSEAAVRYKAQSLGVSLALRK
jgi:hypothetical protein